MKTSPELFHLEEPSPPKTQKKKKTEMAIVEHPSPPENMLTIIARAASDPAVLPDKMRALLSMQKEIMAEEARIAFTQDFVRMAKEMPSVNRDGKIVIEKNGKVIQKTPYATFENMHRIVTPILRNHGFAFWSEPDLGNENSPIIMRGHLDHIRGHGRSCAIPLPFETSGSKNNVQGVGSSLSYGRRYCLMNLCNIISHSPEDRDDDGRSAGKKSAKPEPEAKEIVFASKTQIDEMMKAIEDCGVGLEVVCNKYQVDALRELPADKVREVIQACATFKANQEAKRSHG